MNVPPDNLPTATEQQQVNAAPAKEGVADAYEPEPTVSPGRARSADPRADLDSRGVRPGDLFLAVPGGRQDGRAHIADARRARLPWLTRRKAPESCRPAMRR